MPLAQMVIWVKPTREKRATVGWSRGVREGCTQQGRAGPPGEGAAGSPGTHCVMMAKPIQDPTCGQSRQGEGGQGWAAPAVLVRGWEPHSSARGAWSKGGTTRRSCPSVPNSHKPSWTPPRPHRGHSLSISKCSKFKLQKQLWSQEPPPPRS